MKQFLAGVIVASIVWMGVLYAQLFGSESSEGAMLQDSEVITEELPKEETSKRRSKRKRRGRKRRRGQSAIGQPGGAQYDTNEGVAGDILGAPGGRDLSMGNAAEEDQLSSAEIDRGIDRVFKGIQRCLVLAPGDAPTTGKVVFGMHIASSGKVTKVNLKGPNVMIRGDVGACFRRTAKSIKYRSFDGPDMVAHYPIVFD